MPAELTYVVGALAHAGLRVSGRDLNAEGCHAVLGPTSGWRALQQRESYTTVGALERASDRVWDISRRISARLGVDFGPRVCRFPGVDAGDVPAARAAGLSSRNPFFPTLERAAAELADQAPGFVGIALGYPDQRPQVLALARLLRRADYRGVVVLFGGLSEQLAPSDFAQDLVGEPLHRLFEDVDAVVVGEAEVALPALHAAISEGAAIAGLPNLLTPGGGLPIRQFPELGAAHRPSFAGIDPGRYPHPEPVVDLRLARGCPWNRCAFCAIPSHQPGYRIGPLYGLLAGAAEAHGQLGTRFFRVRDDLLTPTQLVSVADGLAGLGFGARWSARARFEPSLTRPVLAKAAAGGLEELWLGLESASARLRERMDKGVRDDVVQRVLTDCSVLGIRVRALCILGFPGETEAELQDTLALAADPRVTTASLTRFELMRGSPMMRDPGAWGVALLEDSVPRERRLRARVPAAYEGLPDEVVDRRLGGFAAAMEARAAAEACPTLSHGWMRASVGRGGW